MSFTSVDVGFSERRYSFDGPDFGFADVDVFDVADSMLDCDRCPVCGLPNAESRGVWCAGQELIARSRLTVLQAPTNTIDEPYVDGPDSIDDDDEDEGANSDEDDEVEDDDTESERA